LFFLIFGIIAISYFKGKLYFCDIENIEMANDLFIYTKWDCLNAGGYWDNRDYGFDNISEAIKTLL